MEMVLYVAIFSIFYSLFAYLLLAIVAMTPVLIYAQQETVEKVGNCVFSLDVFRIAYAILYVITFVVLWRWFDSEVNENA